MTLSDPAPPSPSPPSSLWPEGLRRLFEPVDGDKRRLLAERWSELPADLRAPNQVVGRQLTHCGYTMGAAYCSFGCTHCYLPRNANSAPLPSLDEMREQIDANHRLLGDYGALQITGGDVLDAYWNAERPDELVEIIRYATARKLVPMLMTHGQVLLENPDYFDELVAIGGLTKVALHIDMTQAGRPGYPIRSVRSEVDLHPLRQQFVELVEGVRSRTKRPISAAHTVTVTERNMDSVGEIVSWLCGDPRRLRVFRMLSLQPEADVGRTRYSESPVTPDRVWAAVGRAVGLELDRHALLFGHPECSSMTTVLIDGSGQSLDMMPRSEAADRFREDLLRVFGGVGSRGGSHWVANAQRLGLLVRNPSFLVSAARFVASLRRGGGSRRLVRAVFDAVRGRAAPLNVVMHNFMSAEDVAEPRSQEVEDRLAACSFRGAVRTSDGSWRAVSMCEMNSLEREGIYDDQIEKHGKLVPLRRAS